MIQINSNTLLLWLPLLLLLAMLTAGCSSPPQIVDDGNPGQLLVVVYHDQNNNGVRDQGERGLVDEVGISQDVSCPAGSLEKVTEAETSSEGEALFSDLPPGRYCVAYMGDGSATSKLTVNVDLSSDQQAWVTFGISEATNR